MVFLRARFVFILSIFACAVGSMTAINGIHKNNGAELCFYLNHNRKIESYANFGMNYYVEPSSFEGRDIVDVLPLSEKKRAEMFKAFNNALTENKVVKIMYDLDGKDYTAKISPLKNAEAPSYFVTVREN